MNYEKIDFSRVDWHRILPALGVDEKFIANPKKRGPCPIEQAGTTRFRFDNKEGRGTWVCNCGAGDGVRLVALVHGVSDAEAIQTIREVIGNSSALKTAPVKVVSEKKTEQHIERARKKLIRVWREAKTILETPAWLYLSKRVYGLNPSWISSGLRFHPALTHVDDENGNVSTRPALVSSVADAFSRERIVTIHRTYISSNGEKASVSASQVKKVMPTTVQKLTGESIKVNTAQSSLVIVAEGIESALAWVAATQNQYAVYAAINCYNMGQFKWPKGTKALVIGADNDAPNPRSGLRPGLHYATLLNQRALESGIRTKLVIPPAEGIDFDDLWNNGDCEIFSFDKTKDSLKTLAA